MSFSQFFSGYTVRFKNFLTDINSYRLTEPGNFWHWLLFASFWLFIALFPIGYGWREVLPPLCFIFLLCYYRFSWAQSVLCRLECRWLFLCLLLMVIIGVVFSNHPLESLFHAGTGVNKAYILPFIAMECVRDEKDLRRLVWASVFACFWEGLDGVWQAHSGYDFIMNYAPNSGRLTGSLGDYTVGNYLALALVPSCSIWFVLQQGLSKISTAFVMTALLWPAFFLFQGASSRSGILAIAGALGLWAIMTRGWKNWRAIIFPAVSLAAFSLCQPGRLSAENVANDNRWDLWRLGWRVFCENPFFGAGAGQYNTAFREMGLAPQREVITISHPHNLYLDLLYAHGLIGFTLGLLFVLGFLFWGYTNITPRLRHEIYHNQTSIYWHLAAWFWLGYAAWLINGIFGHDFYRTWWLAQAMCALGIMAGAIVNGRDWNARKCFSIVS